VKLALAARLMARESRGASGKILFFTSCLAVGVAAVVAVAGLSNGIDRGLRREARQLLAADLSVRADKPIPEGVLQAIDALVAARPGARATALRELATVVSLPGRDGQPGPSSLVLLKAVGDGYPFYGAVTTDPAGPLQSLLDGDGALVAPELWDKLQLTQGSTLKIGGREFVVAGRILAEPDKINVSLALGPRVMLSLGGFEHTGLEAFGSRVERTILVTLGAGATAADAEAAAKTLRAAIPEASGVRVQTYANAQPALRDGLRRASRFLGLVALVSLILGGVGVAQSVRAWLSSRYDAIAILKCLGVRPREIVALYAAETALLGLVGSLAGVAVATAILAVAPRFLTGLLPALSIDAWQPAAALRGLALGTGVAVLFSVPPLSALRLVPPLRVLRRDAEPLASGLLARAAVVVALVAGVFGAGVVQSGSARIAAGFAFGMIAAAGLLAGAAKLLTRVVSRLAKDRVRVVFRHGLSALARPGAGTLPAVTALGLGVLVVVAIALVHRGVTSRLRADLPKDAPNVFLVDLQTSQWPKVRSILETAGATEIRGVPIVNARLVSIDGVSAADLARTGPDEGRRKWILTREQNLTYLDELPKDNVVVEGNLWSDPDHPEISIERDFARDMGVRVGSKLVYDVQGVPFELVVTSLRTVDWKSFGINFFLVVEPGVLDRAPQMRVAAARLPAGREQALQDRLAADVPNVTMLKVREIVEKVTNLLERLGTGIRLLGGFAITAGIAILAGAVGASASRRGREVALLKTLGATRGGVVTIFAVEFALIGLVAGIVGTVGGAVMAWFVLTRGMEIAWTWRPLVLAGAPCLTVALSVVAGIGASAGALRRRPIEALRAE
jgi:putative ABC transport system permease protein